MNNNSSIKMPKQNETKQNSDLSNIVVPRPTHEEIAKLAYQIWLSEGSPDGCAERHWYEAEAQIIRTRQAEALEKLKAQPKEQPANIVTARVDTKPQQGKKELQKEPEKKTVTSKKRPGKNRGQASQSW